MSVKYNKLAEVLDTAPASNKKAEALAMGRMDANTDTVIMMRKSTEDSDGDDSDDDYSDDDDSDSDAEYSDEEDSDTEGSSAKGSSAKRECCSSRLGHHYSWLRVVFGFFGGLLQLAAFAFAGFVGMFMLVLYFANLVYKDD